MAIRKIYSDVVKLSRERTKDWRKIKGEKGITYQIVTVSSFSSLKTVQIYKHTTDELVYKDSPGWKFILLIDNKALSCTKEEQKCLEEVFNYLDDSEMREREDLIEKGLFADKKDWVEMIADRMRGKGVWKKEK